MILWGYSDSKETSFHITPRQTEVLHYRSRGLTVDEIAAKLYISRETVRTHLRNILLETEAKNTYHAISLAYDHKLFPYSQEKQGV